MKKLLFLSIFAISVVSCAELLQIATTAATSSSPVTEAENASGLKSSLNVGIENAVNILGVENGFMNDALVKILLPAEAKTILDNVQLIPGGQELVNKAVLSLNRTAEDAVKEAVPIFKKAILSMSFSDATGILFGGKNAATNYLKQKTSAELVSAFAPKVRESLGKPLVANISTTKSWEALTSNFNKVAATPVGAVAGLKPVKVNLEEYVTQKALDALFMKVADEEQKIRENPVARVSDILKRVFGQLDKK